MIVLTKAKIEALLKMKQLESLEGSAARISALALIFFASAFFALSVAPARAEFGYLGQWGSYGSGNGEFDEPGGVATGTNGYVYVVEIVNNRIQKFDSDGTYLTQWGSYGQGEGEFDGPEDIATDTEGNVYVADASNNRIQKFDSDGGFKQAWGKDVGGGGVNVCSSNCRPGNEDSGDGGFYNPVGVATDSSGGIYVADSWNNRIQKLGTDGAYLTQWGSYGQGEGEFEAPVGVATDLDGNVYVADPYNKRIQKFDSDGGFKQAWGKDVGGEGIDVCKSDCQEASDGEDDGELNYPTSLATDAVGNVYVADTGNIRIQKFDPDGAYLAQWGSYGSGQGEFIFPYGIAVDREGNVYVSDAPTHRIQKFGEVSAEGTAPEQKQVPGTSTNPVIEQVPDSTTEPPADSTADTIAPTIDSFKATRKRLRRSFFRKRKKKQIALKFTLSEDAKVKVRVLSKKKMRRCKKNKKGKKTCKKSRLIVKRSFEGKSGDNKLKLKIASKYLKRGLYRLDAVATDEAGNRSKRVKARLRVVR